MSLQSACQTEESRNLSGLAWIFIGGATGPLGPWLVGGKGAVCLRMVLIGIPGDTLGTGTSRCWEPQRERRS